MHGDIVFIISETTLDSIPKWYAKHTEQSSIALNDTLDVHEFHTNTISPRTISPLPCKSYPSSTFAAE